MRALLLSALSVLTISMGLAGCGWIAAFDTMKISKDQASQGMTSQDAQAVDLGASTPATHITDDSPVEIPATLVAYAKRIHADGKKVWYRLSSTNGGALAHADSPSFQPPYDGSGGPGYLTNLEALIKANRSVFQNGDVLDGDAEVENSRWWANTYGCGVQQGCAPCPPLGHMSAANKPCAPVSEFNNFIQQMTADENQALSSVGLVGCTDLGRFWVRADCVLTSAHSTDPGSALNQLSSQTVTADGHLVTVDEYPAQSTTDPNAAVSAWNSAYSQLKAKWPNANVLVGEYGYSIAMAVDDATQANVVTAVATKAWAKMPDLVGVNYWIGPGWDVCCVNFSHVFSQDANGVWSLRPAATDLSNFYRSKR